MDSSAIFVKNRNNESSNVSPESSQQRMQAWIDDEKTFEKIRAGGFYGFLILKNLIRYY